MSFKIDVNELFALTKPPSGIIAPVGTSRWHRHHGRCGSPYTVASSRLLGPIVIWLGNTPRGKPGELATQCWPDFSSANPGRFMLAVGNSLVARFPGQHPKFRRSCISVVPDGVRWRDRLTLPGKQVLVLQ